MAIRAQRVAWYIQKGEDPYPFEIRHQCNFPPCVNATHPDHLLIGSHQENMDDAVRDGLTATGDRNGSRLYPEKLKRGSAHGMSKLTEDSVKEAHRLSAGGMTCTEIAEKFGVHLSTIAKIIKKKAWGHIEEEGPSGSLIRHGGLHYASKVNDGLVREIRIKKAEGKTYDSLSKEYGLAVYTIFAMVTRKTWKHVE